jgi:hypothetical protein
MTTDEIEEAARLAAGLSPPITIEPAQTTGSFDDAFVELVDQHVHWRVLRERSVLVLLAAPSWDRRVWFDANLLARFLEVHIVGSGHDAATAITQLKQLRSVVGAAFDQTTWAGTRELLLDLGRRRDAELFGRPLPRE